MSALGHKQTLAIPTGSSALHPKADVRQNTVQRPPVAIQESAGRFTFESTIDACGHLVPKRGGRRRIGYHGSPAIEDISGKALRDTPVAQIDQV